METLPGIGAEPPSNLAFFASLVDSDEQFPLLEAAAAVACAEEPGLDLEQVLDDVAALAARLKRRIPSDASALQRLRSLNQYFYRELGFGPAVNDFYAAANSHIHQVLRTRRGIPISLAVIWLEVAQTIGLSARGVGFPGHFLVKVTLAKGQVVIDPLTGQSLSREDLMDRLEPYQRRSGLTGEFEMPLGLYLQAANGREIVQRMCRNLKEIHLAARDDTRLVHVLNRLVILNPDSHSERRDRGLALANLGHSAQAIEDLQHYVEHATDALDLDVIEERINELRRVGH